jgi:hypothetical protein
MNLKSANHWKSRKLSMVHGEREIPSNFVAPCALEPAGIADIADPERGLQSA